MFIDVNRILHRQKIKSPKKNTWIDMVGMGVRVVDFFNYHSQRNDY